MCCDGGGGGWGGGSEWTPFQGKQLCHSISVGSSIKGKNLLLLLGATSFKSRHYLVRASLSSKANRKSQKLLPFVKVAGRHGSAPILAHLLA